MTRTADFIRWLGGTAQGPVPSAFEKVSIDSRAVAPGCLYAALPGANVDGHDFVIAALKAGAALALVRADWELPGSEGLPLVRVPDVKAALAAAARCRRHTLDATVIGVTGSCGKTTTKEFLAAFLATLGPTWATEGNLNNDLGLPLTILNAPDGIRFLVLEMGTNHPGEIDALVSIAHPDAGIITSIGDAHLEFFGSREGVAREKGRLFAGLPETGFAVVADNCDKKEILKSMCRAVWVETDVAGCALACPLPGAHNASDMALAAMCALQLGADRAALDGALEGFQLPGARWRVVEKDGISWIDDAYNANPTSMSASLGAFADFKTAGRRIAVLGGMFELGERSAELHREVGAAIDAKRISALVCVGPEASAIAEGASGIETVERVPDIESARAFLAGFARPGDAVLLKASHGMGLWKLA